MKKAIHANRPKTCRAVAIIGNGFDLAHKYATDYESFITATDDPSLSIFKSFCESHDITTWYSFEENINKLTHELFLQSYSEDIDYSIVQSKRSQLKDAFTAIHKLLINYLLEETKRKPIKLASIKKHLKRKTQAISFNYTDIASAYGCNVFHVHGSLAANDILLGYDYRDEACLSEYDDMRWSKTICREALAFRKYLKNELNLVPGSPEYNDRISGFEAYQHYENSGRGIDMEVEDFIPHYQLVDQFISSYRPDGDIPKINYHKITTFTVIGHGIEADREFLRKILKKCTRLRKVLIFRHAKETDDAFNAKVNFFKPYCKRIRSIKY